jgi:hypothetical protein
MKTRQNAIKDLKEIILSLENSMLELQLSTISSKGQWQLDQTNAEMFRKKFEIIRHKRRIKKIRNTSDKGWFKY